MKWALRVDRGGHKGKVIPIRTSPFIIGRNEDCQLKTSNPYVSQRHCELQDRGDKFLVRDCKSTNGTFVNGQRVEGEVELQPGDRLKISSLAFVVCQIDHKPVEQRPEEQVSPKPPRPVDEDAIGEMLLELDEQETGQKPPVAGAWRNKNSFTTAEKTGPENEPTQTAADVASELLKGKDTLLKAKS
jgi:pSer/pThr/pTyr-binding forkhead associated (FHA) protein